MLDTKDAADLNTGQGTNRFKYRSFNSRVEKIKVDIVRRSRLVEDDIEENGSFFYESLQSWKELNLSKQFTLFCREIQPYVKSLASIVHHKEKIVDILEKYLQVPNSLAYDGLLDLVTKLAKDLEGEFYPFYTRMLKCMLPLVYHQDVKLLECLFNSIAYLFKFLSRQILPDICDTFDMLANLLGEDITTKPYIRHFSAEAFAFLMRKVRGPALQKLIQHILDALYSDPSLQYTEGLAMLFFESMKQIDNRLHSRATAIYAELYNQVSNCQVPLDELESDVRHDLLNKTTLLLLHHTYRQHFGPIIEIVLNHLDTYFKQKKPNEKHLLTSMSTLAMMVTVRKASRIEDFKPILARVQQVSNHIFTAHRRVYCNDVYKETLRTVTGILCFGNLDVVVSGGRVILDAVTQFSRPELVYGFFTGLSQLEWPNFTQVTLPYITKYVSKQFSDCPERSVFFLAELLSNNALSVTPGTLISSVTADGQLRFPATRSGVPLVQALLDMLNEPYHWQQEQDLLNDIDIHMGDDASHPSGIAVISSILSLLPIMEVPDDLAFNTILSLFDSLSKHLSTNTAAKDNVISTTFIMGNSTFVVTSLLGLTIKSLVALAKKNPDYLDKLYQKHSLLVDILEQHRHNEIIVKGIFEYMAFLHTSSRKGDHFNVTKLSTFYTFLKQNLRSYLPNCRLYTLKLLALFDQPLMKKDADHTKEERCDVVDIALKMESIAPSMNDFREKIILIQKLNLIASANRLPDLYADFVPLISFGILTINFKPLWEDARKALKSCATTNKELYWTLCFDELAKFEDERRLVCDGFAATVIDKCISPVHIEKGQATKTGSISFECPTFTKYTAVEDYAMTIMDEGYKTNGALLFVKTCGLEKPHMDFWHYYNMVLQTLMETPAIVEQRARHLVPVFFKFLENEFETVAIDDDLLVDEETALEAENAVCKIGLIPRSARNVKNKMNTWLKLFASFTNLRGMYKSQDLYVIVLRLIGKGDVRLQAAALEVLFAWKDKNIKPYSDNLRNLVDDTKFRDELATFIQNHEQNLIDPAHREGLMPIVMRVLFGRLVERRSKGSRHLKKMRRKAILSAVSCCKQNEMKTFIDLALEPFQRILSLPGETMDAEGHVTSFTFVEQGSSAMLDIAWRQQLGLVNVLEDMIKQLGSDLLPFMPSILKVVLYILHSAQNNDKSGMEIDTTTTTDQSDNEQDEENDEDTDNNSNNIGIKIISNRSKQVRAITLRRLMELFTIKGGFNFAPYMESMFSSFISPRLVNFSNEASQQVTSLLAIFAVWAERPSYVSFLTDYNDALLPQLYSVLSERKINEKVLSTILDILEHLLDYCEGKQGDTVVDENGKSIDLDMVKEQLIVKHVDGILEHMKFRLTQSKDDKRFGSGRYSVREIAIVARLAPYTENGAHTALILDMLIPSLKKPARFIPDITKRNILTIWANFMPLVPGFERDSQVYHNYYKLMAGMFSLIQSRESRQILLKLLQCFVDVNPDVAIVGKLLRDLNARSRKRLDEPDYDRMLDALAKIGEDLYKTLDHHQWLPILHQLFYSMQDTEEMAVRGSATHCASRFLLAAQEQQDAEERDRLVSLIVSVVYPAIKRGLQNRVEIIRMEFVGLLNAAVKTFPDLPMFAPMVCLLGDGDEEVNFFNNIYHIQLHRRVRAMARLSEHSEQRHLAVPAIVSVLIPLISGFIYESDRQLDHNVIHQASLTIGALARCLPWRHYYQLLSRYLNLVSRHEEMEKIHVRLATQVIEAFHFDLSHVDISDETAAKIMGKQKVTIEYLSHREIINNAKAKAEKKDVVEEEIMDIDAQEPTDAMDVDKIKEEVEEEKDVDNSAEAVTAEEELDEIDEELEELEEEEEDKDGDSAIPAHHVYDPSTVTPEQAQKIHDILISKVLPELNAFISKTKSRKSVISRMPVALGIAKLLRQLPEKSMRLNLPGLLTIVCQTIRSRAQDVRDVTRDTLLKINAFLGTDYFKFIIKELRGALARGYELHVLGFTVNALLHDMAPRMKVGDLDYCLEEVVQVLVSDIFGKTGQEKDAEEMTGKTKEAKSRRSPAAFELLAKLIKFENVGMLLVPLKEIMSNTQSLKILQKVDDILRRTSHGLVHNPGFDSVAVLDFANDLISENVDVYKAEKKTKKVKTQKEMNFEVQMKRVDIEPVDYLPINSHRFVYFGLSLLGTSLKRNKFDLTDDQYKTRLDKLVMTVGNILFSTQSANVGLAAKNLCTLFKFSSALPSVQDAVPVAVKRIFQLLKNSPNTNNPTIQSCFKLLMVCIQSKKSHLSEHQLTYLINVIRPDLEEPTRQGTAFGLVRGIVSRKFLAPEMYDLMDTIGMIMVTNQTPETREQARSLYFLFLMDYPQGRGRLKKQMAFIIKNLEYVHETGRQSVMELLHHIISKFGDDILSEFSQAILMALVMRLINDESAKCREMTAELIKALLLRMDDNDLDTTYRLLDKWMESDRLSLQRAGCQMYGLVIDAYGKEFKLAPQLIKRLATMIQQSRQQWMEALEKHQERDEDTLDNEDEGMDVDIPWEVGYYSLNTFTKVTSTFPKLVYADNTLPLWSGVITLLLHPHTWIRSSTARLFGVYFAGIDPVSRNSYLTRQVLRELAYSFVEQLKSDYLSEDQANQLIKNLFFIGRCLYHLPSNEDISTKRNNVNEEKEEDEEEEEEAVENDAVSNSLLADQNVPVQVVHKSLLWLFHKASYTARGAGRNQGDKLLLRSSIFKWFAAMCNVMEAEELPPYLFSMIAPIYHTVNGQVSRKGGFDDLKTLGNEVLGMIQKKAGPTAYFAIYQNIRQHSTEVKEERKSKRAVEAVTHPELAAKRKMARNLKKSSSKRVRFN